MRKFKNSFFYLGVIGGCSAIIYWFLVKGVKLETGRYIILPENDKSSWKVFLNGLTNNLEHPLAMLLFQIITIILVARLFGYLCKKIGQPRVIGEIIAGIVLGPSLVGMYFPEFSATLFPIESLGNLHFLSQIGLILFMFVVGMELDLKILRNQAREAVVISHASIIIPFSLGLGLAYFIYRSFAPEGVQFSSFALFIGIAMSITAFPVLARIVQERGLHKTRLGTVVITCAAADDITAWCLLAAVIAIVKAGSFVSSIYIIALAFLYVLLMIYMVRPFLKRIGDLYTSKENLSKPIVAIFFLTLIISSYTTEVIGIHALFGAFTAGAIMPENIKFRNIFIEKVEDVALILLLPLFFVFTGLRTQIGLLNDIYLWKITALIILVAVVGKFIGSAIAARVVGQNWKDSLTIGALMNTRGLMELVVLNIGYDLGVLKPEIFAMMVIMALVTTIMTGPALNFINWAFKSKTETIPPSQHKVGQYKVLVAFGNPERGKTLLRLASSFITKFNGKTEITALHMSQSNEMHHYNLDDYEKESFAPIIDESKLLNQKITTLFKASNDIDSEISEVANKGGFDLLLIGVGKSIFEGSLLGRVLGFTTRIINPEKLIQQVTGKESPFDNSPLDDRTRSILTKSNIPVGVLIDKGLQSTNDIFIPLLHKDDGFLLNFAQKLLNSEGSNLCILDSLHIIEKNPELKDSLQIIDNNLNSKIQFIKSNELKNDFWEQRNLMLVSIEGWKKIVETKENWLTAIPATLIMVDKEEMSKG